MTKNIWIDKNTGDETFVYVRFKKANGTLGHLRGIGHDDACQIVRALDETRILGIEQGKEQVRKALGISQ